MSIVTDVSAAKLQFSGYVPRLRRLLSEYSVKGYHWYDDCQGCVSSNDHNSSASGVVVSAIPK